MRNAFWWLIYDKGVVRNGDFYKSFLVLHFLAVLCTVGVKKYIENIFFKNIFKREVNLYLSKIFWTF